VEKIVAARQVRRLRDLEQLGRLGISVGRAAPFVLLDGRRPAYQTRMFARATDV
jgi:predicted DNA-binding helix-hairpin-helix protein